MRPFSPYLERMKFRSLGLIPYAEACQRMQDFTQNRNAQTEDEIWFCEHQPVFTLGWHSDPSHLLNSTSIPIEKTDRGGQITYHGPGQLMVYFLVDLKRGGQGIAAFVFHIESMVIELLNAQDIAAHRREGMPGVYVGNKKICSIGLRVKKGCTYHGLALNVAMDLKPFQDINPCGYKDLQMTQIADYQAVTLEQVQYAIQRYIENSPNSIVLLSRPSQGLRPRVCR